MNDSISLPVLVLGASCVLTLAGCSDSTSEHVRGAPAASQGAEATPEPTHDPDVAPTPKRTPMQSLLDAQIVRVADVLDASEVEQGQLAMSRARDPQVQAFAQRMVRQHSDSRQRFETWQRRAAVTPEESTASAQLQNNLTQALHTLDDMDPSMFDATYVHSQVQQHHLALDMLDRQLIPNATDPELKAQLRQRRELIAAHLADAQQLHTSLAN
jgi:putative membrane protein